MKLVLSAITRQYPSITPAIMAVPKLQAQKNDPKIAFLELTY
jgi:hypothetical protein